MNEENKQNTDSEDKKSPIPNENVGFCFSSGIKIIDPNTKETIVELRGD